MVNHSEYTISSEVDRLSRERKLEKYKIKPWNTGEKYQQGRSWNQTYYFVYSITMDIETVATKSKNISK
jgi:hypothetical protein